MKTRMLRLGVLIVIGLGTVSAQMGKNEKFEVAGNCDLCEHRIEKAATSVGGVNSAEWNKEIKMLEVIYDSNHVNIHKVHKAIAKAGYDTKMIKAGEKAYDELPACCKYERMSEEIYQQKRLLKIPRVRGAIEW